MSGILYLDSSALLQRALDQPGADTVDRHVETWLQAGATLASSRLLWLESRRTIVRERLMGNEIAYGLEPLLTTLVSLPVSDDVWAAAYSIESHVGTLGALHIATCQLAGATLLTFEIGMRRAAESLGVALADAA
jgi:predicted nucleic acid-binding protein